LTQLAQAEQALAEEARAAGAPATAVNGLVAAGEQLNAQLAALQPLADDPAQAAAANAKVEEIKRTATAANVAFATALLRDADARNQSLPAKSRSGGMKIALQELRTSVEGSANSTDPVQSLGIARDALAKSQAFSAALASAYGTQAANQKMAEKLPAPKTTTATTTTNTVAAAPTTAAPAATTTTSAASSAAASGSKKAQLSSIVSSGRSMAKAVIQMGNGGTAVQKENARLAKNYDKYLANVADSARGASTDREYDELIKKANQTKAYITFLHKQSSAE
jgi:hypothetical protein